MTFPGRGLFSHTLASNAAVVVAVAFIAYLLEYMYVDYYTALLHFLAHVPISESALLLEYRHMEVNCNIYNMGAPAFSIIPQNVVFRL